MRTRVFRKVGGYGMMIRVWEWEFIWGGFLVSRVWRFGFRCVFLSYFWPIGVDLALVIRCC